ncbi:MAG TPA: DUF6089 family protein, partial [Chitinophagaceae bacterium]|nr:DUF6089 family protein [Chitinophagaceae bacterium]
LYAGDLNYNGDLQQHAFTFSQSHFGGGLGATYDLNDHFAVRSSFIFGKLSADDKYGRNAARNLNFISGLTELNLNAVYYITPMGAHALTPYVFAGVAMFHFNPYTYDTAGIKTYLRPLSTEGEGFISGRPNYSLTQIAIPFGAGVKFSLSDNVNVGLELGYRKSFTDYVDDVSGRYVDEATLLSNRGSEAAELAYRGDEIKNGTPYPPGGTLRGSSSKKDWYYFTALTASFRLFSGNGLGSGIGGGRHAKYGCPVNVR